MTVIVIGDLVTDVLAALGGPVSVGSDTPATIRETGGGSAANTACWLASLGVSATLVAVVGNDPAGRERIAELSCDSAVRIVPGATTGTVIVLSTPEERSMVTDRGANGLLTRADIDAVLPHARHVHLSGYVLFDPHTADAGRYALSAAHERGITTSVDAGSARPLRQLGAERFLDWISGTDLLLANLAEAQTLMDVEEGQPASPTLLAQRLAERVRRAVVKLGAGGAIWAGSEVVKVPAVAVGAVDATGAGDAFAAGLLAAWLSDASPVKALTAGAALGAQAVTTTGARPR